jgi:hypothetical protein
MPQTNTNSTFQGNTIVNYTLEVNMSDANTAGSVYVVAPFKGKIVGLYAVNGVTNTTAQTVLLAKLGGVTVTAPAWTIGATQAAGTASSSVPTAANTFNAGDVIEINSDGGGTPVMPITVIISIDRQ